MHPYVLCVSDGAVKRVFVGVKEFVQFYSLIPNAASVRFEEAVKYFQVKYPGMTLTILDKPITLPIEIKNDETGHVYQFDSTHQAAKSLGLSVGTVTYALRTEGHHLVKCYRIRHCSVEKWPEARPKYKSVAISAFDRQTGTTRTFSSLSSFSKYSGLALKLIKRMLNHELRTDRFELHKI